MQEIPQDILEKALALTGKTMDDMKIKLWDYGPGDWYRREEFSYPKFFYYLLSPEFIEKYIENGKGEIYPRKWDDSKWILSSNIGKAIYEYQKGNAEPLVDLLSKI